MGELIAGLAAGRDVGFWVAGVAVALAWMSRGISPTRLAALAIALLWPLLPIAIALNDKQSARRASEQFASLCAKETHERILRRSEPVSAIFIAGTGAQEDSLFRSFGNEVTSRLLLEQPGYSEIHVIENGPTGSEVYSARRRGQPSHPGLAKGIPLAESLARYGVRFEFRKTASPDLVREFRVMVIDRQTNEVLAEQRSFLYRSRDIAIGGFPLWRQQERACPLAHPTDFVRSALPPRPL